MGIFGYGICDIDDVATDQDWDRADARQSGMENPDQAWVCTDRDVWHANPYYKGLPVPHPNLEWEGTLEEYRATLRS